MKPLQEGVRRVEAAGARSVSGQIGRLDEGPRRRKSDSQNKMGRGSNSAERSSDRYSKHVPRMTKRIFFYLVVFILAQMGLGMLCLLYYRSSSSDHQIATKLRTKSKFVNFPENYQPPCQIKAKEALSALNRVATSECKRELAEIACKSESGQLYAASLPNLCPATVENGKINAGTNLGCFRDEFENRILQGSFARLADNSRGRCVQICSSSGFKYAGTQYGRECFCGNQAPSNQLLLDDDLCDKPCTGDQQKACGGYLTMNIYQTNPVEAEHTDVDVQQTKDQVRIVYLLTVNGRAVRQLKRLIKKLFDGRNFFYIHVDARQDYIFNQMKQLADKYPDFIRVSKNRFSTIWGGASLLRMLVSCMTELLAMDDWKWDFVLNLSESDYPLKSPKILTDFLSDNRGKNFVKSHGRDSQVFVKKQGLDRTFHECDTHMFRLGVRDLPEGIVVDGGSDWVCLNRKFVDYIVSGDDELLSGLRTLFNYTLLPAESFFHTTLKNSQFCSSYVNNNLRMTNWKRHLGCKCQHKAIVDWCGCSPNDFLPDDWHKLNSTRSKDIFFARKFEPIVNQAVLDMVDQQLIGQKSNTEKSYLQNIYHYLDISPKPDPAVLTLSHVLSESSISIFGLKFEKLEAVTSFHYDDIFEGIVLTFGANNDDPVTTDEDEAENFEQIFEALVRIKTPESTIDFRSGELAVGTDFDPKELLFRNFFSAIGPLSKPVLTYDFVESLTDRNVSAKIIWRDPVGQIAYIHRIQVLNNSAIRESLELKDVSTLLPGIWTVVFVVESQSASGSTDRKNIASKIPFLVTPLLPVNEELLNDEYLKSLHRGKLVDNLYEDEVENVESNHILHRQAERNAEKLGSDLSNWISELASSFYSVEFLCRNFDLDNFSADQKLLMMPKCVDSEWSTFYPDKKSEL